MAATRELPAAPVPPLRTEPTDSSHSWPAIDRIGLGACWAAGIALCAIAVGIMGYMLVRGVQYVRPSLLFEHPSVGDTGAATQGGILDPMIGTVLLILVGIAIAVPIGVATALWLSEYGRPRWLARAVESGVEIVAGTPSIVLAIFGLILFSQSVFAFLSFTSEGGGVFGRSFLTAGAMMSLIALPLVVGATREALQAIPQHVREASYALGKTKAATIRRVLLPAAGPGIATGTTLGIGRIAGDTAIVVLLLGSTLNLDSAGGLPLLGDLRGTGSTLTSYVYGNSPAGEGNTPEKAYAAAFVLLIVILLLNLTVDLVARRWRAPKWTR